ncbi:TPA: hypothetical protein ACIGX0_004999, partial [Escherichia coli]
LITLNFLFKIYHATAPGLTATRLLNPNQNLKAQRALKLTLLTSIILPNSVRNKWKHNRNQVMDNIYTLLFIWHKKRQ